jgi:hypothetical protein
MYLFELDALRASADEALVAEPAWEADGALTPRQHRTHIKLQPTSTTRNVH